MPLNTERRRYFTLLGDRIFRRLFLATFASSFGNWLAVVALQIDVYDRTHSGWWVGALLVANILPAVFLGALLGTVAAYIGLFGWFRTNTLEGGVSDIIDHVPWDNLFLVLIAMPVVAILIGWVLAGREPTGISTRPME